MEINYCEINEIDINGVQQLIKVLGLLKKPYNDYEIKKYENKVKICGKKNVKLYDLSKKRKIGIKEFESLVNYFDEDLKVKYHKQNTP